MRDRSCCRGSTPRSSSASRQASASGSWPLRHARRARSSTSSAPGRSSSGGRPTGTRTSCSGTTWPPAWWRDLDYAQLDQPSDVKVPWEISRLQWLLPAGQAYLLDGDERHAQVVRETLEEWIEANPYGASVNWASPMEAAIRIFTFTWLFHALGGSDVVARPAFRLRLPARRVPPRRLRRAESRALGREREPPGRRRGRDRLRRPLLRRRARARSLGGHRLVAARLRAALGR